MSTSVTDTQGTTMTEQELFDSKEYEVPFPQADGREVDQLVVRVSGRLVLNRNDPEQAAMIEGFTLGRYVTLTVLASVDGKHNGLSVNSGGVEVVSHTVTLGVQSLEPA